jgi:signal transduction histidine kinase
MTERFQLRWPGTVRWRVTVVATAAVAVVLVVTGLLLLVTQRRVLEDQLDESLAIEADHLVAEQMAFGSQAPLDPRGDDDAIAQLETVDGNEIAWSSTLQSGTKLGTVPARIGDFYATENEIGPDGESYRVLSRRFAGADGTHLVLHVGTPRDDIEDALRSLVTGLRFGVPAVTVILAALIWIMVGRTLRPVERIRTEVAAIGPAELGRRVPAPPGGDEIARLAATMNAMLERLDEAAQRQRQFTADASHELRTPLTRLRAEIEVELRQRDDPVVRSLLHEVDAMEQLINDLLALARSDEVLDTAHRRLVDLDDIVLEEIAALDGTAVDVDARQVSGAQVRGVSDQLRRVVRNLLDNAVRHARSSVIVRLEESNGDVVLSVADDGPGIPAHRRLEVFERFRRLDESRSGGTGGAGLGLSIARDVVERHGGTISIDPDHEPGARLVVTLPKS